MAFPAACASHAPSDLTAATSSLLEDPTAQVPHELNEHAAVQEQGAPHAHPFPPLPEFLEGSFSVERASVSHEGLVTEAEWWASARDWSADLSTCNDPLAGANVDFASSLRMQSQWELDDPSELKHPWEEGVFKDIFGRSTDPIQWALKRPVPILRQMEKAAEDLHTSSGKRLKRERVDTSFELVVKHRAAVDWKSQRLEQLDIDLKLWLKVTSSWEACLLRSQLDEMDQAGQITLLGDILHGKAPSTVLKRARSLVPFMDFLKENETVFPCDEEFLYSFLKKLESSGQVAPVQPHGILQFC